jgi:hypothetical protein
VQTIPSFTGTGFEAVRRGPGFDSLLQKTLIITQKKKTTVQQRDAFEDTAN